MCSCTSQAATCACACARVARRWSAPQSVSTADALLRRGVIGAVTWADGHVEAAGLANVTTGEPITPQHRFRIGSATTLYVAYLTTRFVDDLDEIVGGGA